MNYKKFIPNKDVRLKVLKLLDFLPDKIMIIIQYRIATGRKINFKKLERFTEKIQWYKLYYKDPLMKECADKYLVRKYIEAKGYKDILVPLYGVYSDVDSIKFNDFPQKFVLKTTNGGGNNNVFLCNKDTLKMSQIKEKLNKSIYNWSGKLGREWVYYNSTPSIICEAYLEKDSNGDLIDYKFFCFDGEPYYLYVIVDRDSESGLKLGIYDMKFEKLPYFRSDIDPINRDISKPKNFERMVEIAKDLSKDFPHVRVDLYNIDGRILFGELTFFDGSGYKNFKPDEFDYILGKAFRLPSKLL